jgi:hypothetical protein
MNGVYLKEKLRQGLTGNQADGFMTDPCEMTKH